MFKGYNQCLENAISFEDEESEILIKAQIDAEIRNDLQLIKEDSDSDDEEEGVTGDRDNVDGGFVEEPGDYSEIRRKNMVKRH